MAFAELIDVGREYVVRALDSPEEEFALLSVVAAGALVLVSGFVKTMIPLRWLAIGSNLGFVLYGALHPSYPMLVLHATLLPINLVRLVQMVKLTRRVEAVRAEGDPGLWLKPYMRSARLEAGTVLFRQGDRGDRLYLLAEGRIDMLEVDSSIRPGQIFGEIAFFAPDRRRRATALCVEDSTVLSIDEATVKELYYQNPAFGFRLIELVATRFAADVGRLSAELKAVRASAALNVLGDRRSDDAGSTRDA